MHQCNSSTSKIYQSYFTYEYIIQDHLHILYLFQKFDCLNLNNDYIYSMKPERDHDLRDSSQD